LLPGLPVDESIGAIMGRSSPRRQSIAQVVLGLFVVWQLLFLGVANILPLIPHGEPEEGELSDSRSMPAETRGPNQDIIDRVAKVSDRWAAMTGQVQAWWLFAPDFPRQASFPLVELRWHNDRSIAPIRLHSPQEPTDPHEYLRLPGSMDRFFHYEVRLGLIYLNWDGKSVKDEPEAWRQVVTERVRRQWKSIRAYLRWRLSEYQRQYPYVPTPDEMILSIRLYRTPEPGASLPAHIEPLEQPLARWRPGVVQTGCLPIEVCDPVTRQFISLSEK
jgi:hypothetical protein